MKLILVGLPAVGKTYYGRQIANHFNVDFLDLDELIERQENSTIAKMVEEYGLNHFREIEQNCLKHTLSSYHNKPYVLACGGGTPCYKDNLKLLKDSGIVIYLRSDIEILARRIIESNNHIRPLFSKLSSTNQEKKLRELNAERRSFYEQSHIITDVSGGIDFHLLTNRVELFTETQYY